MTVANDEDSPARTQLWTNLSTQESIQVASPPRGLNSAAGSMSPLPSSYFSPNADPWPEQRVAANDPDPWDRPLGMFRCNDPDCQLCSPGPRLRRSSQISNVRDSLSTSEEYLRQYQSIVNGLPRFDPALMFSPEDLIQQAVNRWPDLSTAPSASPNSQTAAATQSEQLRAGPRRTQRPWARSDPRRTPNGTS